LRIRGFISERTVSLEIPGQFWVPDLRGLLHVYETVLTQFLVLSSTANEEL
jgi:hypothetical protein